MAPRPPRLDFWNSRYGHALMLSERMGLHYEDLSGTMRVNDPGGRAGLEVQLLGTGNTAGLSRLCTVPFITSRSVPVSRTPARLPGTNAMDRTGG